MIHCIGSCRIPITVIYIGNLFYINYTSVLFLWHMTKNIICCIKMWYNMTTVQHFCAGFDIISQYTEKESRAKMAPLFWGRVWIGKLPSVLCLQTLQDSLRTVWTGFLASLGKSFCIFLFWVYVKPDSNCHVVMKGDWYHEWHDADLTHKNCAHRAHHSIKVNNLSTLQIELR